MHKSSLVEIIKTFTPKELIKFQDFVSSPYFNKNKNVINLFAEVKKYAPEFTNEKLEKEKIWTKLFPGKEFNYGIIKNIIHDMNKLCETFILLELFLYNDVRKEYEELDAIFHRQVPKVTIAKLNSVEKSFQKIPDYGYFSDYLFVGTHLHHLKHYLVGVYGLKQDSRKALNTACDFVLYYFMNAAFVYLAISDQSNLYITKPKEVSLLEKFFKRIEENSIFDDLFSEISVRPDNISKTITGYYYQYKSFKYNDTPQYYYEFKNFLRENRSSFNHEQLDNFYIVLTDSLQNLRIPDVESNIELFDLLKFKIENKILFFPQGRMDFRTLTGGVLAACNVKELDFAENFLTEYIDKVHEPLRENTLSYCLALISFAKTDYVATMEHLSKIQLEVMMLKYLVKSFYIMLHYELNDYESFVYALDAFKHFNKKNKLLNEASEINFNKFSDCVKTLFKLKEKFDTFEIDKLKKIIKENKLYNNTWLLNKIKELDHANMPKVKG